MGSFKPPKLPAGLPPGVRGALDDAFLRLYSDLRNLERNEGTVQIRTGTYRPLPGETVRVSPAASGMAILLPAPEASNRGKRIRVFIENPDGALRVFVAPNRSHDAKVNGAEIVTFSVEGLVVFESNGINRWNSTEQFSATSPGGSALDAEYVLGAAHASLPNGRVATDTSEIDAVLTVANVISWALKTASVALTRLAVQAADTFLANITGSSASPTAVAFTTLTGRYLTYEGSGAIGFLYDKTFQDLRDCFFGGNLTSGSIGELGWSTTATGTNSLTRFSAVAGHVGVLRISTGGGATGRLSVHLGPAATGLLYTDALDKADFLLRTSSLVAGATNARSVSFGGGSDIDASFLGAESAFFIAVPGTDIGLGAASNNWQAVCRTGSANTVVDTGVAATGTTNWKHFRIRRVTTGTPSYLFYIDDMTTPVATITSGFPTGSQNVGMRVANADTNAGAHTVDWDEYTFRTSSLGTRIGA